MIRSSSTLREELWRKFLRNRRRRDRNLLAESYLPIVRGVAEQVSARVPRSIDPEDLFAVGAFGLIQSIESYDPRRGAKFETFCRKRVRGAMMDELRSHDRLSRDARDRARVVLTARVALRQELGREPTHHELTQRVRLSSGEVERALATAATRNVLSLDARNGEFAEDNEPLLLADDLVDDEHLQPPEAAQRNDLLRLIEGSLSSAERNLVRLRYGDGLTMRRIGRRLGLSESRVCQLHSRLLLKLHRRLAADT